MGRRGPGQTNGKKREGVQGRKHKRGGGRRPRRRGSTAQGGSAKFKGSCYLALRLSLTISPSTILSFTVGRQGTRGRGWHSGPKEADSGGAGGFHVRPMNGTGKQVDGGGPQGCSSPWLTPPRWGPAS